MIASASLSTDEAFVAYSYAYPHKTAYRTLQPAVSLSDAWREENQESLFVYFHLPFCEYRCGFCNLFTLARPEQSLVERYLSQIETEAQQVRSVLMNASFARVAIGGGTPTFLSAQELYRFLQMASQFIGHSPTSLPVSCEASPATLTGEKAAMLRDWGVKRLSLGVQAFDDRQTRGLGRPQDLRDVVKAIQIVRDQNFPTLNLDLIYGSPSQSLKEWHECVDEAMVHAPEEIYLYPLYVRELTGLDRISRPASQDRMMAYRQAREQLLQAGYVQRSLRMFEHPQHQQNSGPVYCCQSDGMVGLGCGARSYTRALHYSTEFSVGRNGVRSILLDYLNRNEADFRVASHGFSLDLDEQRRRYLILSLLQVEGMPLENYRQRFRSDLWDDYPELAELINRHLAEVVDDRLRLTAAGIELSDAIGPWLYSPNVQQLMSKYGLI